LGYDYMLNFRLFFLLSLFAGFAVSQTIPEKLDSLNIKIITDDQKQPKLTIDPWLAPDKGYHFLGSFMITVGGAQLLMRASEQEKQQSVIMGAGFSFTLGLSKEIYDSTRRGNRFSYKDLLANLAGIFAGVCILQIK